MDDQDHDLRTWLVKELGPGGYRRLKAMQDRGMTLEQALEAHDAIERLKNERSG